jgi:hypothetical protein
MCEGRNSVVGTATRYGLDGPGIESRWGGEIFGTHPDRPCGPQSLLYNGYQVPFPKVKRPGRSVNHPPISSAKVKERVELYLYSPLCAFMAGYRVKYTCMDTMCLLGVSISGYFFFKWHHSARFRA